MMLRHAAWSSSRQYSRRALLLLGSRISPQYQQHHQVVVSLLDPSVSSLQGVRWKRRDGNKAFDQGLSRPPTKKQRKAHNRKLQKLQDAQEKHAPPGSKAGPRREWIELMKQDILTNELDTIDDDKLYEYGEEDALLDDLMGNTAELTSQPTPQPAYLGHKHGYYHQQILQQLNEATKATAMDGDKDNNVEDNPSLVVSSSTPFPSDRLISLALRSYRDKHGTKQKPIGLAMAVEYILQELKLPWTALGENSWTTLLTCCRTPAEGRKVLQLQIKQMPTVSAYSWSILVDLHAKVGDFQGCAAVLRQMEQVGVPPTLPAYTSLIAACGKVCNNGRIAHSVRAQAAREGSDAWVDMRTKGIDPDAMAYGAMLQLTAAVGHAERALNVLEEMEQMQVKPTTYCFSCALRAVAKSHATAIRFERGSSKRNKRREFLAKHHGLMAREIVIKAESADVKQDAGFVSALILCAAAAGDTATAKAIYVASQIRSKLDHFRTIGPDSHLARLRGEEHKLERNNQLRLSSVPSDGTLLIDNSTKGAGTGTVQSFEEREYGKDSRPLSAVLHACAQAVDQNGIGTIWQGRENLGYLCDNSLRLIVARGVPRYEDTTIPGQTSTADLTWDGESKDEDYRGDKRRSRKFSGVYGHENGASTIDELDDMFHRIYVDEDGRRKPEFRSTTPDDIWRMKYSSDPDAMELFNNVNGYVDAGTSAEETGLLSSIPTKLLPNNHEEEEEMYFDYDTMRWKTRSSKSHVIMADVIRETSSQITSMEESTAEEKLDEEELFFNSDTMRWETRSATTASNERSDSHGFRHEDVAKVDKQDEDDTELYFDYDTMRWQSRPKEKAQPSAMTSDVARTAFEARILETKAANNESETIKTVGRSGVIENENGFHKFFEELQAEVVENGGNMDNVSEEEARELFLLMQEEYEEAMNMSPEDLDLAAALGDDDFNESSASDSDDLNDRDFVQEIQKEGGSSLKTTASKTQDFQLFIEGIKDDWRDQGAALDDGEDLGSRSQFGPSNSEKAAGAIAASPLQRQVVDSQTAATRTIDLDDLLEFSRRSGGELSLSSLPNKMEVMENASFTETVSTSVVDEERHSQLEELRQYLPAFPEKRLRKILRAFRQSLGDPSLLTLVPIVRERMPDYITATWLKQMSALTARYVVHAASEEGLVDIHMLNGVLELETLSGRLDRALEFYETEFSRHNIEPNEYSNRLVLQMFVKNGRISRALAFKNSLIEQGRSPDILSYGSLIEYCGRHNQLGSALLLLKECISVHGAPPGEASLKDLRRLCRQDEVLHADLSGLVGSDPVEWLRHGEAHLKREYSKKGRRDVLMARNRLVHL